MANKSKKAPKNNKNLIIGICAAVVLIVIAIIVAVVMNNNSGINDNYFVSDSTKYVLTIDLSDNLTETEDGSNTPSPIKMHSVYNYEGDTITGLKSYYEYADAASAKTAYDAMAAEVSSDELGDIALDGKYIVFTSSAEAYEDMTVSDVKQQIEFMEMLQSMDSDDLDYTEDVTEVEESEE